MLLLCIFNIIIGSFLHFGIQFAVWLLFFFQFSVIIFMKYSNAILYNRDGRALYVQINHSR